MDKLHAFLDETRKQDVSDHPLVLRTTFSLADIAEEDRFDAWRESISVLFNVEPAMAARAAFDAGISATLIGELMVARCTSAPQIFERTRSNLARDGFDFLMFQFYETGRQSVDISGKALIHHTSNLLIYDMMEEFAAQTTNFSNISLLVPRQAIECMMGRVENCHMQTLPDSLPAAAALRSLMTGILDGRGICDPMEISHLRNSILHLVCSVLLQAKGGNGSSSACEDLLNLHAIYQLIADNLSNPRLNVSFICEEMGISKSALYRKMKDAGSIGGIIRQKRMRRAQRALLNAPEADTNISQLAVSLGYADQSSFSRAFREHFGFPPGSVKRNDNPRCSAAPTFNSENYADWIRMMG